MNDKLVESIDYGRHVGLVCKKCGAKFHTKNISPLGCRTIFYNMNAVLECAACNEAGHTIDDLTLIKEGD